MRKFLLDSDIIGYLGDTNSPFHISCTNRLESLTHQEELCAMILTVYEMDYSISSADELLARKLTNAKEKILRYYRILALSLTGSERYGTLKSAYKSHTKAKPKAMKVHTIDIILAATALEHDAVVVSNDRIFTVLQGIEPLLKVENWAK